MVEIRAKQLLTLHISTKFIKCDVTDWDDQVKLFDSAKAFAPDGKISYVVANSGVTGADDVFSFEGS